MRRSLLVLGMVAAGVWLPAPGPAGELAAQDSENPARILTASTDVLDRPARLEIRQASLPEALSALQRTADILIAFSPSLLPEDVRVDCDCAGVPVRTALDRMLSGTGFRHARVSSQLFIEQDPAARELAGLGGDALPASRGSHAFPPAGVEVDRLRPLPPRRVGTLSIRVAAEDTGAPLAAAQVTLPGTNLGGLTGSDGRLTIEGVRAGEVQIQVQRLGYATATRTVTVASGETVTVNFSLRQQALGLDAIVVTGTPGEQQARSLGNTVGRIQASELQRVAPQANLETMLSGTVPGMNVAAGGGAIGGGSNIRIRGAGSIALSSQPLIYIDGVRANSAGPGQDVTLGVGNSRPPSRLNDLSPEMIESIEVIKGPAAATLYGTEASNGVINIITKQGAAGDPIFTLTTKVGQNWYPDPKKHWPGSYFTCRGTGTHGCTPGEVVYANVFWEDYVNLGLDHFRVGTPWGVAGSVAGGTDRLRYNFLLDWDRDEAPMPTNQQDRLSARANLNWLPREDLTVSFGLGVIRSELLSSTSNQPAVVTGFHWSCPGAGCERGTGLPNALDGPFRGYIAYLPDMYEEYLRAGQDVNRNTYSLTLLHRPTDWFSQRLILGIDHTETQGWRTHRHTQGKVGISFRDGARNVEYRTTQNLSIDYSLTGTWNARPDLSFATSTGIQHYDRTSEWLVGNGTVFAVPALRTISAGTNQSTSDGFIANKTIGMYVQEQMSWQNRLFLTAAVRGDDNSAFGSDFNFVVYPKFSASWVASEEAFLQDVDWLSSLRFRTAWGRAGQQPDQFAAVQLYQPVVGFAGTGGVTPQTLGNPGVEPEVGEELELGFDLGVLGDRLGVEFTYYNQRRRKALIEVPVKPSTGFPGFQLQNIGEIQNQGLEVGVEWDAYRGRDVSLQVSTSVHFNRNEVKDLGGLEQIPVFGQNASTGWSGQRHIEGFPIGSIFLPRVVSAQIEGQGQGARAVNIMCESGPIVRPGTRLTRGGGPAVPCTAEDAPEVYMGTTIPTREATLNATLALPRNVQFFANFDYAGGHMMIDGITAAAHTFFRNTKAIHERTDPILLGYDALGAVGSNQPGLFDPSQVTLRNVSLAYTIPQGFTDNLGADRITVTFSGQNLWRVWRAQTHGFGQPIVDSEIRTTGGGGGDPGGIAAYTQDGFPLFKRFLTTVRMTF
jgi:TonB-linked SusC/RagA family outer membrane protein